ncbi:MAG: alpha/beta hydrolase [Rhodoferax sp.]|uniref:alpha/beta fold hydrolase n=1 Tax=Rhodoferax sp. TaxID=50421 RepID=UPI00262DD102|nr:alpha/beta hydrolase [Rhodoferax sp.]MDD2882260.1 alpha/beta hydrolase [Rhodoferax sp.]
MTTWLLLRGLTRESGHWGSFLPLMQQACPDDVLLPLDFAGNGVWHDQASPWTVQGMVAHCRGQLEEKGIQPPYHVLAMSLGAMVAVAWAQTYPEEISRQVLINTSLRPFNPFYQRFQPRNIATIARLVLSAANASDWEHTIWRMTSRLSDPDVINDWVNLRQLHPVSPLNSLRQLWAAARFTAPAQSPATPTLLLASTLDSLVSVQCSRSVARAWHWPLAEHPTAGHDLPLDDADWVVKHMLG